MTGTPPGPRTGSGPGEVAASEATTGRSVLAGGAWNTVALVLPQLYTLLISVAIARFLGPEEMGRQSFIAFVQLSLFLFLANGMPGALSRYTGELLGRRRPDAVHRILRWTVTSQVVAAVLAVGLLAAVGLARDDLPAAWVLAGVACAAAVLHAVPSSMLMGLQRFREASMVGLATGALGVGGTIAVLAAGGGIVGLFALEAGIATANAAVTAIFARRALETLPEAPLPRPDPPGLAKAVARYASTQTLQTVIYFIVWRRSEFFFLDRWTTENELAMYSVAFAATTALVRLPQGASGVLLPAIATLHGAGETDRVRRALERSIRLLLAFSLPLTAAALALGPGVVRLVYGAEYERASAVLVVLLAIFPLLPLFNICSSVLQGIDRLGLVVAVNVVATVVNLVCDVVLIDRYGAMGAAWANVAAQGVAAVLLVAVAVRLLAARGPGSWRIGRNVGAAALAGLAAWLAVIALDEVSPLAALAAGGLSFAVVWPSAALGARVIAADDARWLADSVGPRIGPTATRLLGPFLREGARTLRSSTEAR